MNDPAVPADLSLVPVLTIFQDAGWTANHITRPGAKMKCGTCSAVSAARDVTVGAMHRIEGASDPDDLQTVLGTCCPSCHVRGVLVAAHGPAASSQDDDFLVEIAIDTEEINDPVAVDPQAG